MKQLNLNDLTESPEATFELIADGGKAKSVRSYQITEDLWFSRRPTLFSRDPEYPGLTLRRYTATRSGGGVRTLTLYYEAEQVTDNNSGEDSTQSSVPTTYDIDITLNEEPLLAHKNYISLEDAEKDALLLIFQGQEQNASGEKLADLIVSPIGQQALSKYRKGITHTREPSIIWSERRTVDTLSSLNSIGKISAPPGPVPVVSGGRNWLYIGLQGSQSEEAKKWTVHSKWELSGSNGWDADLY